MRPADGGPITDAQISELSLKLFYEGVNAQGGKYERDPYNRKWVRDIGIPFARAIEQILVQERAESDANGERRTG